MKPAPFAYAKARSLEEAVALLGEQRMRALLAGGQSLIATLEHAAVGAGLLIDINGIGGLDGIALKDGMVEIGALTRHAAAERSEAIAQYAPLIARALPHIGHAAIRNRGTLGGSIAFADPAAELPACLLALGGEVDGDGPEGQAHDQGRRFFQGPVRDRARAAGRAHRHPRAGRRQEHARRICRIGAPPRRLRHCRAGGLRARRWQRR